MKDKNPNVISRWLVLLVVVIAGSVYASGMNNKPAENGEALCSNAWKHSIENKVLSGDGAGHGPDVGSDEWQSVIEFKLGVRGDASVPKRNTHAWCQYIDKLVNNSASFKRNLESGPSFACEKAQGSIETLICGDKELSALDLQLASTYAKALNKAKNEHPPMLKAQQRGWIKGRNECWKSDNKRQCTLDAYQHRIATLQANYRLVSHSEPIKYVCNSEPRNEVIAMYFDTTPKTLIAERGDSVSLMFLQPSASGSKYQGRNETLWEHQGEAQITWGYDTAKMDCKKMP